MGAIHKTKVGVFEKLQFLDGTLLDPLDGTEEAKEDIMDEHSINDDTIIGTEQVITDNQEYYEVRVYFFTANWQRIY